MTNKDRLISLLGFSPDHKAIEGAMIDWQIEPEDTYDGSNVIAIKSAAIELIELLFTTADTSNDQGFSVRYDRGALEKRLATLREEVGIVGAGPVISSPKVW